MGLGYSAFARHYWRNHYCFLLLRVLRCFSSPGSPHKWYYVFNIVGCPIRKSTDQCLCAAPRSLSQLITSFFASVSLGIRRTPLITSLDFFYYRVSSLNMSMNSTLTGMVENNGVEPKTFSITRDALPLSYFLSIKIGRSWEISEILTPK